MDLATFIVSETKAAAWPAVVLMVVVLLRQRISTLISELGSRLQSAKAGGFEFNFGARIDEVEKSLPDEELKELRTTSSADKRDDLTSLLSLPPAYIISQAWLSVEYAIEQALGPTAAYNSRRYMSTPKRLYEALGRQLITKQEKETLDQLRQLRNEAAHSLNPSITLTDAIRYADIAKSMVRQIVDRAAERRASEGDRNDG